MGTLLSRMSGATGAQVRNPLLSEYHYHVLVGAHSESVTEIGW